MDVCGGLRPACVPTPLALEPAQDFGVTFIDEEQRQQTRPEQLQYTVDSASAGSGKAAAPCKVCGDKASGYHYGVTSCEGCKGFFRRSIQKQIEYRCLRDGKCIVIRLNRNRCQFCRFKKCLAVGMSRDSVRYGRVPKKTREVVTTEVASSESMANLPRYSAPPIDGDDLDRQEVVKLMTAIVTMAHQSNNTYTEELRRCVHRRALMLKLDDSDNEGSGGEEVASSTTDRFTDHRSELWCNVAVRMTPAIQHVVEFAKRLPGFHSLPQDDQLILIKLGFFEVWLTRASRLSTTDCMVFDDGTAITREQLEIVYDRTFATAMLAFVRDLNNIHLSEEEMALLTASMLLCPERNALNDPERISQLHRAVLEAMHHVVNNSGVADVAGRLDEFAAVTRDVRMLGHRHQELLGWCREHWPRLKLPALFSEMFDIPKTEEASSTDSEVAASPLSQFLG